jgi:hypothetical protein
MSLGCNLESLLNPASETAQAALATGAEAARSTGEIIAATAGAGAAATAEALAATALVEARTAVAPAVETGAAAAGTVAVEAAETIAVAGQTAVAPAVSTAEAALATRQAGAQATATAASHDIQQQTKALTDLALDSIRARTSLTLHIPIGEEMINPLLEARQTLNTDPLLSQLIQNPRVALSDGRVTLTGQVAQIELPGLGRIADVQLKAAYRPVVEQAALRFDFIEASLGDTALTEEKLVLMRDTLDEAKATLSDIALQVTEEVRRVATARNPAAQVQFEDVIITTGTMTIIISARLP